MAKVKTVITEISKISDHPIARGAALLVIHGAELGRKYDLVKEETSIGRSSKCDIQVDQEWVSRNHCRVLSREGEVTLEDLGSTNGTLVNDARVRRITKLKNGDLVKVGRTIFKFVASGNIEGAYHDEIYRLTTIDGLTQVFNRRYFEETLEREIARCHRYEREMALILIDIDHFKQVNDRFGHLAGDHILKGLAKLIQLQIRRADVFARYGGEEFAILLPEVNAKGAMLTAEKTRKLVERTEFRFDRKKIPITISLGVAALTPRVKDAAGMIKAADARLYEAKQGGRNRCA